MSEKMLINGKLVDGAAKLDVINPATAKPFITVERADEAQLDEAVAAAKAAFPAWAALSYDERGMYLSRLADALEANAQELAHALTSEQGKPLNNAMGEAIGIAHTLRYYASQRLDDTILEDSSQKRIIEQRRPLGVVAAITPWNFPLIIAGQKIGPALITGNTVVLKPAPTTPVTSLILARLAADILPAGVLNVIVDDNDLGGALSNHPDVRKVSFTGSTATGRKVMASGADSLMRITLELGGNDAAIVLDDADINVVAPKIFGGAMANSGQVCLAIKRAYVPAAQYDDYCDAFAKLANDAVLDDGANQGTEFGPVQNAMQYDKLKQYLDIAQQDGTVIAGGELPEREGYFVPLTIVKDIAEDSRLVKEEQFGPILPVLKYEALEDVIARANDSDFGLGGSVWTSNIERGIEVAAQINTGTMWVNQNIDLPAHVPFGGAKQSGIGRENGEEGLLSFTQGHIINVAYA